MKHPQQEVLDRGLVELKENPDELGWHFDVHHGSLQKEMSKIARTPAKDLFAEQQRFREQLVISNKSKTALEQRNIPRYHDGEYVYGELPWDNVDEFGTKPEPFIPPHFIHTHHKAVNTFTHELSMVTEYYKYGLAALGCQTGIGAYQWFRTKRFPWYLYAPITATAMGLAYGYSLRWGNMLSRVNAEAWYVLNAEPERFRFARR